MRKREITLIGAISIGIGGMVGGGIFAVLGVAVSLAHGATPIAFLIAGIIALITAYSYAKLSLKYQSEGGTIVFIEQAFGKNLFSGAVNLMLWLSYLVTISLYATAFSYYALNFFHTKTPFLYHTLISIAIILPGLINLISASFVSKSESILVIIKIALLILIIITSIPYISADRLNFDITNPLPIITAGMIIFVAYEGFELIANSAQELQNPDKNLPIAFYSAVIFVIILYVLIAIVTVGCVDEQTLLKAKDYALAQAAKPSLGEIGFIIVSIAALLATFSAINATIYGNARLGYILASHKELPTILKEEKRNIPFMGDIITLILSLILANSINLEEISIIGSASFLLIFLIVNLSAFKLSKEINSNKIITLSASLFTFISLIILLYHTYSTNPKAIFIFFGFILISIFFEYFYSKPIKKYIFHK